MSPQDLIGLVVLKADQCISRNGLADLGGAELRLRWWLRGKFNGGDAHCRETDGDLTDDRPYFRWRDMAVPKIGGCNIGDEVSKIIILRHAGSLWGFGELKF
jgi:hypothetical protein